MTAPSDCVSVVSVVVVMTSVRANGARDAPSSTLRFLFLRVGAVGGTGESTTSGAGKSAAPRFASR